MKRIVCFHSDVDFGVTTHLLLLDHSLLLFGVDLLLGAVEPPQLLPGVLSRLVVVVVVVILPFDPRSLEKFKIFLLFH